MVENPPDDLSSLKYYAAEPERPVDLDRWHTNLRRAIIAMRREGAFSRFACLGGGMGLFSITFLIQTFSHPVLLVYLACGAGLLLLTHLLETRWIRARLENSDLVERFYQADPGLIETGVRFGVPVSDTRPATRVQPVDQTRADLRLVTGKLTRFLLPPHGDFLSRYSEVLIGTIVVSGMLYILVRFALDYFYIWPHPDDPTNLEILTALPGILLLAYLVVRSHIWTREFCSAISRRFGPDLVYSEAELALGPDEFARRILRQTEAVRRIADVTIILLVLVVLIAIPAAFMVTTEAGLLVLFTALWLVIIAIQELNLPDPGQKEAIHRAQVPLKLLSMDYLGETFRDSTNQLGLVLGWFSPPGSIIRTAMLIALEPGEYLRMPPPHNLRRRMLAGAAWLGGFALLSCCFHTGNPGILTVLLLPVPVALLIYFSLSRLIRMVKAVEAMLECLREQVLTG